MKCFTTKKRILAMLMTVLMIVGLLPVNMLGGGVSAKADSLTLDSFINLVKFVEGYEYDGANKLTYTEFTGELDRNQQGQLFFQYTMPANVDKSTLTGTGISGTFSSPFKFASDTLSMNITNTEDGIIATVTITNANTDTPTLTIKFKDSAPESYFASGTQGEFAFTANLNESKIENGSKQNLKFTIGSKDYDLGEFDFKYTPVSATVTTNKQTIGTPENGKIKWQVTSSVKADDLPTDTDSTHQKSTITITDTPGNSMTYSESEGVKIVKIDGSEVTDNGSAAGMAVTANTSTGLVFNITNVPLSSTAKSVTIEYYTTYDIDNGTQNAGNVTFKNDVSTVATYPTYKKENGKIVYDKETTTTPVTDSETVPITVASITKDCVTNTGASSTFLSNGLIEWKITASSSEYGGLYVVDTMSKGQELVLDGTNGVTITGAAATADGTASEVKVLSASGSNYYTDGATNSDGSRIGVGTTTGTDSSKKYYIFYLGANTGEKTITYYTKLTGDYDGENPNLTNSAELYYGDGKGPIGYSGDKYYSPSNSVLNKEVKGYDASTQQITWEATINNSGYLSAGNLVIDDTFNDNIHQTIEAADDTTPFTVTVTTSSDATETYKLDASTNKLVTEGDASKELGTYEVKANDNHSGCDSGFTINVTTTTGDSSTTSIDGFKKIVIQYVTKLSNADAATVDGHDLSAWINKGPWVSNTIKVNNGDGTPTYSKSTGVNVTTQVLSKDNKGYNYQDHKQEWEVTVNAAKMEFTNPTIEDSLDSAFWNYDTTSLEVYKNDDTTNKLTAGTDYTVTYTDNDNTTANASMKIEFKSTETDGKNSDKYVVKYKTVVADLTKLATNEEVKVSNTVKLTGSPIDTTEVTVTKNAAVKNGQISKTCDNSELNSERLLTWSILVNENLATFEDTDAANNTVVIYDKLQEGLIYTGDTTITPLTINGENKYTEGTALTLATGDTPTANSPVVKYDEDTRVYSVTFLTSDLDQKAYKISLGTRVLSSDNYDNIASIGEVLETETNSSSQKSQNAQFGTGVTRKRIYGTGAILIKKTGSDDENKAYVGAEFTISKLNAATGEYKEIAKVKSENAFSSDTDYGNFEANVWVLGLPYGTYKVEETSAGSDDYTKSAVVYDNIVLDLTTDYMTYEYVNEKNDGSQKATGTFSKVDAANSKELPGATLTVTYKNGTKNLASVEATYDDGSSVTVQRPDNKTIQWTSSTKAVKLSQLPEGEYEFTETTAPAGYEKAETIGFKVEADGKIYVKSGDAYSAAYTEKIIMEDAESATFSKVDATNNSELAGAQLEVELLAVDNSSDDLSSVTAWKVAEDGITSAGPDVNIAADKISWTSSAGYSIRLSQLPAGKYKMVETQAPEGYALAEAIEFKIDANGYVYKLESGSYDNSPVYATTHNQKITMKDAKIAKTTVKFSKRATGQGEELPGATLTVYNKTNDLTVVESWTSGSSAHEIALSDGEYILVETQAPLGYAKAEQIEFKVDGSAISVKQNGTWVAVENSTVVMYDDKEDVAPANKTTVKFSKVAAGQGNELKGALLGIYAAGDFNTAVHSWISDGTVHSYDLDDGEYYLVESQAPLGYDIAAMIRFRVNGTDITVFQDGKWVTAADSKITMIDYLTQSDDPDDDDDEEETTTTAVQPTSQDPTDNAGISDKDSAKNTGDYAPIAIYVALLLVTAGTIVITLLKKKRS